MYFLRFILAHFIHIVSLDDGWGSERSHILRKENKLETSIPEHVLKDAFEIGLHPSTVCPTQKPTTS